MISNRLTVYLDGKCGPCCGLTTWAINVVRHAPRHGIDCTLIQSHKTSLSDICREAKKIVRKASNDNSALLIMSSGLSSFLIAKEAQRHRVKYYTFLHSDEPSVIYENHYLPRVFSSHYLNLIHKNANTVFVSDEAIKQQLIKTDVDKIKIAGIGVDTEVFVPKSNEPTGRAVYVGKITNSSGLSNFLCADIPFKKVVIGDGKSRHKLSERYPDVEFLGWMTGELLVRQYQTCDIVVNPSKTNSTNMSFLEAAACGKPYAGYFTESNKLLLGNSNAGHVSSDLSKSCIMAYNNHSKEDSLELAARHSWGNVASIITKTINED